MPRATFAGLDISDERWRFCVAAVDESESFQEDRLSEVPCDLPGNFWLQGEKLLGTASLRPVNLAVLDRHLESYAPPLQALIRETGQIATFGLAVPYCAAPAIRQRLAHHRFGPGGHGGYHIWEAPIAAAIEAVVHESSGAEQLILTPAPHGAELTALRFKIEGNTVNVNVVAVHEFARDPALPMDVQWTASPPALRQFANEKVELQIVGSPLAKMGSDLAKLLNVTLRIVPIERISAGAARLAALANRMRLYGTRWTEVKVQPIVGRPIGVIGVNQSGDKFWRLLFGSGTPYAPPPTCQVTIRPSARESQVVQLADVTCFGIQVPRWLCESDATEWQGSGLRTYAQKSLSQQHTGTLEIKLKGSPRSARLTDDLLGVS